MYTEYNSWLHDYLVTDNVHKAKKVENLYNDVFNRNKVIAEVANSFQIIYCEKF